MDQPALCWGSWQVVQRIDKIKPPIHEKQLKFCYFWNLAGSHRSHCWKGGLPSRTRLAAFQGFFASRGGVGEQACSEGAMLRRIFDPSEPAWETSDDDRAKLEGSQRVATSSPFDISGVVGVRRM